MSVATEQQLTIRTYANGFGTWCAQVSFNQPLSESELAGHLPAIESAARAAIVDEITVREQRTHEGYARTRDRIEASIETLRLVDTKTDAEGRIRYVIFVE